MSPDERQVLEAIGRVPGVHPAHLRTFAYQVADPEATARKLVKVGLVERREVEFLDRWPGMGAVKMRAPALFLTSAGWAAVAEHGLQRRDAHA